MLQRYRDYKFEFVAKSQFLSYHIIDMLILLLVLLLLLVVLLLILKSNPSFSKVVFTVF